MQRLVLALGTAALALAVSYGLGVIAWDGGSRWAWCVTLGAC